MDDLQRRVRTALNEARILALSSQMLIGTELTATFHRRFSQIDSPLRSSTLAALSASLVAFVILLLPTSFHQLVLKGGDTRRFVDLISKVTTVALLPTLAATALVIFVAASLVVSMTSAAILAAITAGACLVLWFKPVWMSRAFDTLERHAGKEQIVDSKKPTDDIEARIDHVLTEARVVLPGVQAFVGFQFAAMLTEVFERLPQSSKLIHLISLALVTSSGIILISPAAFHRLVERGALTERFHRVASALVIAALVPLALGFAGDFYVVARETTDSVQIAATLGVATVILTYMLWFGFSYYCRRRQGGASA